MLTSEMIKRVRRFEDSIANARAGLWRCSDCRQTYLEGTNHACEYEVLERLVEAEREIGTGALR